MTAVSPICYCLAQFSESDCPSTDAQRPINQDWLITFQVSSNLSRKIWRRYSSSILIAHTGEAM